VFHLLYNYFNESRIVLVQNPKGNTIMPTTKTVNYTPEAVATLKAGYDGSADEASRKAAVAALAIALGKNIQSIRAKLTNLDLYVPMTQTATGRTMPPKVDMVGTLESVAGFGIPSAAKMTRVDIANLTARIVSAVSAEAENDEDEAEDETAS
jgi:hypothetical protein